jgi:hypothetical protein
MSAGTQKPRHPPNTLQKLYVKEGLNVSSKVETLLQLPYSKEMNRDNKTSHDTKKQALRRGFIDPVFRIYELNLRLFVIVRSQEFQSLESPVLLVKGISCLINRLRETFCLSVFSFALAHRVQS